MTQDQEGNGKQFTHVLWSIAEVIGGLSMAAYLVIVTYAHAVYGIQPNTTDVWILLLAVLMVQAFILRRLRQEGKAKP
jgi:hypothetical protein